MGFVGLFTIFEREEDVESRSRAGVGGVAFCVGGLSRWFRGGITKYRITNKLLHEQLSSPRI
jgi:hypothetical protein